MNRADISLNNMLLQKARNQLVQVTAAARFQRVIVLMPGGAGKQSGWITHCQSAAARGWMGKCDDCMSSRQTNKSGKNVSISHINVG